MQHAALAVHPCHHITEPAAIIEPFPHCLHLGRRRLTSRVEQREAEGGREERAAAGEVVGHSMI